MVKMKSKKYNKKIMITNNKKKGNIHNKVVIKVEDGE
jgi:hypothetical protein